MYVDTDILYAAFVDKNDRYHQLAVQLIKHNENKYSSIAALIELEFVVRREFGNEESKRILELLESAGMSFKSIDLKTFELSIKLRGDYGLSIMDSIHASCALLNDKKIASTDSAYDRINELKRIY